MTLRLRRGVSLADTEYGIAVLDEDNGKYFDLNPTGALVLRTLLAGGTAEQAAGQICAGYDVDPATAAEDVAALLADFRAAGLVTA